MNAGRSLVWAVKIQVRTSPIFSPGCHGRDVHSILHGTASLGSEPTSEACLCHRMGNIAQRDHMRRPAVATTTVDCARILQVSSHLGSRCKSHLRHFLAICALKSDAIDLRHASGSIDRRLELDESISGADPAARAAGQPHSVACACDPACVEKGAEAIMCHSVGNIAQHQSCRTRHRAVQPGGRRHWPTCGVGSRRRIPDTSTVTSRRSCQTCFTFCVRRFGSSCCPGLHPTFGTRRPSRPKSSPDGGANGVGVRGAHPCDLLAIA
mmetsp:Transcript_82069/g.219602  ORF Transcript_82069/g.219602 Transcript_82069/m.219602 type:complete len:267 (+) Transcript_82069:214-1014(+)